MKCLNCDVTFHETDIDVMEDWDLQLCDDCEGEVLKNETGLSEWEFLKKHLLILSKGDNFLTAFSASEIIKKMDSIERKKELGMP
jgi:NAD-dependent SIR2 family protein deacetylase